MPLRAHDVVEGHLEHPNRLDRAEVAEVLNGVRLQPLGELRDLGVGHAGVSLAHVQQLPARPADGKRIVAEQPRTPPMAVLSASDYDIQRRKLPLQLHPRESPPTRQVGRVCRLDHHALVGTRARIAIRLVDRLSTLHHPRRRETQSRHLNGRSRREELSLRLSFERRDRNILEQSNRLFKLLAPLDDSHAGEDIATLDLSSFIKAVDFDGDAVTLSGDFNIAVIDDVPVANTSATPVIGSVDEGALTPATDSYGIGNDPTFSAGSSGLSGSLQSLIKFGADGPGATAFQLVDQTTAGHWLSSLGLTSHIELIAHAIGIVTPIFTSYIGHKKLSFQPRSR